MSLLEEIFYALGQVKVFSTLDLYSNYHQLPLKEGDKVKKKFWGIDHHWKDYLYQWKFLPFGLKSVLEEFQGIMDGMLASFGLLSVILMTSLFSA
jgi:hypothetical protein